MRTKRVVDLAVEESNQGGFCFSVNKRLPPGTLLIYLGQKLAGDAALPLFQTVTDKVVGYPLEFGLGRMSTAVMDFE